MSLTPSGAPDRRVALCITCLGDQIMPEIGVAAVRLLKRAGYRPENAAHAGTPSGEAGILVFPPAQTCCGQPFSNSGFLPEARRLARRTIEIFEPFDAVVLPSGSCAAMIRVEYPHLFEGEPEWKERAARLADKTYELTEFIWKETDWRPRPNPDAPQITYHDSCHMNRLLGLSAEPRQLLRLAGCQLVEMDEPDRCCGFGGLFSIRMPEVADAMSADKLERGQASGARLLVTADPGCLMQMRSWMSGRADSADFGLEHVATLLDGLIA